MKKSTLKKLAAQVPKTDAELQAMLQATIEAQTAREKAVAERDSLINAERARIEKEGGYDAKILEQDNAIARNMELIETWAVLNKPRFGKAKSTTMSGVRFGWRLGNWATELKGKTRWLDVVAFLEKLIEAGKEAMAKLDAGAESTPRIVKAIARCHMAEEYLRVKTDADKNNMLRDRDKRACRALLKKAGVCFAQDESFYIDPDREGQEPARIEAA